VFSGGEPFLIPIYYKIWERMLAINPHIIIAVVTNGTILNDRIKEMLERGRFRINVSIDSVHKETYESIRRNSDFDTVMANFEWFMEYGKRKKLLANIPVCPLTVNWSRIPEVVRFANEKNVSLNFVYVDRPFTLALTYSKPEYLQRIIEQYNLEKFDTSSPCAENNIKRFRGLIDDIATWRENNIHLSEKVHIEGDLMQAMEIKIMNSDELENEGIKKEMILKIKDMLTEIPTERHDSIIKVINNYSPGRIHHFLDGKNTKEIAVFFKEFTGK
jgi:sulfatase maturation enzyme AslB (radical SAM superfamily)